MVNWQVRIKSPQFWVGVVGAIGTCVTAIAGLLGYQIDVGPYTNELTMAIYGVFAILALVGVVTDPTTSGVSDSTKALTYTSPVANAVKSLKNEENEYSSTHAGN